MCRDIRVGIPCWPDRWTSHCYTIRLSKTTSSMEVNRLMWERHLALRGTLHHVNLAKSSHAVSCFHVKQYWHDKSGEDQTNNRITGGLFVGNIHFFCFWLTFGSIYSFIIYYVYVCVYIHTHLYIYIHVFFWFYILYTMFIDIEHGWQNLFDTGSRVAPWSFGCGAMPSCLCAGGDAVSGCRFGWGLDQGV